MIFISNIRHQTIFIAECSPQNGNLLKPRSNLVDISWPLPPTNCYKINVDGSFTASSRSIHCGGLVRDSHGHLIQGLYNKLDPCNSAWADLGINKLIIFFNLSVYDHKPLALF
jgi:hypothetical protein